METTIERYPIEGLKAKLDAFELEHTDVTNTLQKHGRYARYCKTVLKHRRVYAWTTKVAKEVWGDPDCHYQGEWRFAVYGLVACSGRLVQRFLLWCDPVTARKGSSIELIAPYTNNWKLIAGIAIWLHEHHPETLKEASK